MMATAQDIAEARECIARIERDDPNARARLRPGTECAERVLRFANGEYGQHLDLAAVMDVLAERAGTHS